MGINEIYYSYELDKLVRALEFVPYKLKRNANYEVGKTYWCSYWSKWYEVLAVNGREVTIKWQDGKIATHSTALDTRRDYELRPFESLVASGLKPKEFIRAFEVDRDSYTAAEIKALCCADVIDILTKADLDFYYFSSDRKPNDYVYYFVEHGCNYKGIREVHLLRDTEKSPRRKEMRKDG